MDLSKPKIRLRLPSPSPPRRITLQRRFSSSEAASLTPHRRVRTSSTHCPPLKKRKQKTSEQLPVPPSPIPPQLSFQSSTINQNITSPECFPSPTTHTHLEDAHESAHTYFDDAMPATPLLPLQLEGIQSDASNFSNSLESSYEHFVEAVIGQVCAIYQLTTCLFVVNGWNTSTNSVLVRSISNYLTISPGPSIFSHSQPGITYHEFLFKGKQRQCVCALPIELMAHAFMDVLSWSTKTSSFPIIQTFQVKHSKLFFGPRPMLNQSSLVSDDQTFLVSRLQELEESAYLNLFSVPTQSNSTLRNRSIVQFRGSNDGVGNWTCNKHSGAFNCPHIFDARHSFQRIINGDTEARDDSAISSDVAYNGTLILILSRRI